MRRVSTTIWSAVAALALLGATPMVWASGGTSGGGTSGGGSTSSGSTSGGGTSGGGSTTGGSTTGGSTSGGTDPSTGGSGGGGGGSSAPPCMQMTVTATPKVSVAPDGYYVGPNSVQFVTTITNCSTVDQTPTVLYGFQRVNIPLDDPCSLSTPVLRAQVIVPAGETVTFSMPYAVQPACDGDYIVYASADLKGGSVTAAMASDTFTFVEMMP